MEAKLDGRAARRAATRLRITTALRELLASGQVKPTAESIAKQAGVSLRSIYQHFSDLDDLFAELARGSFHAREGVGGESNPCAGPLGDRIANLVLEQARYYEEIRPTALLALRMEHESEQVARAVAAVRAELRRRVSSTFAPELAQFNQAERDDRTEACILCLAFSSFELLRSGHGLSRARYLRVTGRSLELLLAT